MSSGLSLLGVSLDGARQETYEQYRVGGHFDTVVRNMRLVNEAKRRLGSSTPRVIWSYHAFAHNRGDVERARSMAEELGVELSVTRGWVEGPDWDTRNEFAFPYAAQPGQPAANCHFLWERAVVHVDGGVAPCDGTYFKEDDFDTLDRRRFKRVWNNPSFRAARQLFRSRDGAARGRDLICFDCPATLNRDDYRKHLAARGDLASFTPRFSMNDGFNFFFETRHRDPARMRAGGRPAANEREHR